MMKKITLIMSLVFGLALNAQTIYFEDFEGQTAQTTPTGFTVLNEDACTINNPENYVNETWTARNIGDAQGLIAMAQSWTTVANCQVDKWLITPQIDLTTGLAGTSLSWLGSSFEDTFLETYEVLLSTTGTAVADFTVTLLTVTNEPSAWTSHTVDLSAYLADNVYIAFRLISADKSRCLIDEIKVASPPPYELELGDYSITDGVNTTVAGLIPSLVVDFSKRTNVELNIEVNNLGTNVADTIIVKTELYNTDESVVLEFNDTVFAMLAAGATYTHSVTAQDLTASFPGLGTSDPLFLDFSVAGSQFNPEVTGADSTFTFITAPTESYVVSAVAPYSNSFELFSGQNPTFANADFGWKFMDNNNDDNTLGAYAFTNIPSQDGDYCVIGSIENGSTASLTAEDETLQSPELTLTPGAAYEFSIYASTFLGATAGFTMVLTDGTGSFNTTLGSVALAAGDSSYQKYSFQILAPTTPSASNFLVNINKDVAGFLLLDLFEIVELAAPAAPTVQNSWEACTKEVTLNIDLVAGSSFNIDWKDGSAVETGITTSPVTHVYSSNGNYDVEVTAENILGTSTVTTSTVNAIALPTPDATFSYVQSTPTDVTIDFTAQQNVSCFNYDWNFGDNSEHQLGGTTATHQYLANGTYDVILFIQDPASGENSSITQQVVITGVVSAINDIDFVNGINVFPNPVSDVLNINFELNSVQDVEISLHSIDGKVVKAISNSTSTVNEVMNTSKLSAGIYILDVTTEAGKYTTNVVVK